MCCLHLSVCLKCSFLFGRIIGVAWKSKRGEGSMKGLCEKLFQKLGTRSIALGSKQHGMHPSSHKIQLYVPLWGVAASKRRNKASLAQTPVILWKLHLKWQKQSCFCQLREKWGWSKIDLVGEEGWWKTNMRTHLFE